MATKTTWGSISYSTEAGATRACVRDWLTGPGERLVCSYGVDAPRRDLCDSLRDATDAQLAHELLTDPDARRWISLDDEDDEAPTGELRLRDEAHAQRVIAEIRAEALAQLAEELAEELAN